MRGKGRASTELARKREQAAFDLAVKELSEAETAAEMDKHGLGKVTQQAVSKMLLRVEERTLKSMSAKIQTKKVRHEAALWKIYHQAMAAWEASKQPQKSLTTKHGPTGDNGEPGKVRESQSMLRDQDGNPRYLEQARQALADIRKIWGVDATQKLEHTGKEGGPVVLNILEEVVGQEAPGAIDGIVEEVVTRDDARQRGHSEGPPPSDATRFP